MDVFFVTEEKAIRNVQLVTLRKKTELCPHFPIELIPLPLSRLVPPADAPPFIPTTHTSHKQRTLRFPQ